jgi:type II secretory pathway component PulC
VIKDNLSPEEKLLRLIRGQKGPAANEAAAAGPAPEGRGSKRRSGLPIIKLRLPALLSVDYARRLLLAGLILSLLYLAAAWFYPLFALKKIALPRLSREELTGRRHETLGRKEPLDYYLNGLGSRQIFSLPAGGSLPDAGIPPAAVNADLTKDLSVVGIISGSNPQAIIEDKKNQRTYYVSKGQFINELKVLDIQQGKVILDYRGQRFELHM